MSRARRGVVLLEVIVALVVAALTGSSAVRYVSGTLDAHERLVVRELEMVAASSLMAELVTLERRDLVIRLGRREVDGFSVTVGRPRPELFRIGIAHADRPTAEILATAVFRAQADTLPTPRSPRGSLIIGESSRSPEKGVEVGW